VKQLFEDINRQLSEVLQIKLWPAGHLPFFCQSSLKANIAERCRVVNDKKVALDAKIDTSASTQRLELLERDLEDLKERVQATERLIRDEKNLIASSKQEAKDLTTQLKTELAELSVLSQQIVLGEDNDDEAAIAEVDHVHLEAIGAIDEFL
jgi:hypothetical protein